MEKIYSEFEWSVMDCCDLIELDDEDYGILCADGSMLDSRDEIAIEFVYPLERPVIRTFERRGGFSKRDFAEAVSRGYAAIYSEEEKSRTLDPAPSGMLLNRSRTDGVHGIWGHGIGDLVLEGAGRDKNGVWHPYIGS